MAEHEQFLFPAFAMVSRNTGEIHIEYQDGQESCRKFGQIMTHIGRQHQAFQDLEARKAYEERMNEHEKKMGELEKHAGLRNAVLL